MARKPISMLDSACVQNDAGVSVASETNMNRQPSRRRSGQAHGILRVLMAQGVTGLLAVLVSWWAAGAAGAVSAFVGVAAYFVPNALFAMHLLVGLAGSGRASPLVFFAGEAFKLAAAIAILWLAGWYGRDWLVWPALLFGLLCVLKGYVLLLALRRMP
ncbi:ATP synthase protein I [Paracandidimonas soli]|uniref:ATP synthase protein I n=2 Tax=Paracandidimonas soli TaxID=1917182 RepID=A0A4R3VAF5_9BURK|nr:ATP synthase protein I [Paracandidimonas soli]